MDMIVPDLLSLAEEHFPVNPGAEAQTCRQLLERHLSAVQAGMGVDVSEKLRDVGAELGQLEKEAAFLQGLRLGLALQRL